MNKIKLLLAAGLVGIVSCSRDSEDSFAYGNFEAEEVIVSAENTGKVLYLNLQEGMQLNTGDLVLVTDTVQFNLKKEQLLANIQSVNSKILTADAQLKAIKVGIRNLEREQIRVASLLKEGAATEKQMDDINGQFDSQIAQQGIIEATKSTVISELSSLKVQIKQIEDQLSRCYVYSPSDGIVLGKYISKGELAVQGRSLFKIADMINMELRLYISGAQLGMIKPGDTVRVNIDSLDEEIKNYKGIVYWVSEQSEFTPKIIQTREERINLVYQLKVRVINDGYLKIGMPADISLIK